MSANQNLWSPQPKLGKIMRLPVMLVVHSEVRGAGCGEGRVLAGRKPYRNRRLNSRYPCARISSCGSGLLLQSVCRRFATFSKMAARALGANSPRSRARASCSGQSALFRCHDTFAALCLFSLHLSGFPCQSLPTGALCASEVSLARHDIARSCSALYSGLNATSRDDK